MSAALEEREFEFGDAAFGKVRTLLKQRSGIDVGEGKRMMVYGRLVRRLRALRLRGFQDYLPLLEDPDSDESKQFLNALTTNVTELFREAHHFEFLTNRVIPETRRERGKQLRIWSAGCSTGEEPYSIAITLQEAAVNDPSWAPRVLATDIDSEVLSKAERGVYAVDKVRQLEGKARRWFQRGQGPNAGLARVRSELRDLIAFRQLNLLGPWPMRGPFDAIFCRNVVIYFDTPTREALVNRFAELLRDGGYLFMGHSESLTGASSDLLEACGKTTYRKLAAGRKP